MLRIYDDNAGSTDDNAASKHCFNKKLSSTELLRYERMWKSRAHHLESEKTTTKEVHNVEMTGQKRKYEAIIATTKEVHNMEMTRQKKRFEVLIADKVETINKQKG